jgi:hypothetical protein
MYLGIILSIIGFLIFYYFIKQEIICQCDDNNCDCFTKKHKIAVKYGILAAAFTFMSYLIFAYQNEILLMFYQPPTNLQTLN